MGLELVTPQPVPLQGAFQGPQTPRLAAGGSRLHARRGAGGLPLSARPAPPGDSWHRGRGQALSALAAPRGRRPQNSQSPACGSK